MFQTSFHRPLLSLLAAVLLAASTFTPQAAAAEAKPLSRADVEKIVHDYIMEHPDIILTAVDQYQQKTMQERQTAAVESNKEFLFRDERSPFIGNPKGDVTIVEFFDYNCGYCKRVLPAVQEAVAEDKNLKVIFKDLPILGPTSETAAKWALAAQKQKKYFEFHSAMMKHQGPINDDVLTKVATDIKLDIDQVKKDIESTDVLLQIERNRALSTQMGIGGTPAFVIGTEVIPGAVDKNTLLKKIADVRKQQSADKKPEKKDDKKDDKKAE